MHDIDWFVTVPRFSIIHGLMLSDVEDMIRDGALETENFDGVPMIDALNEVELYHASRLRHSHNLLAAVTTL